MIELQKVVDGVVEQTESSDQIHKMSVGEFGASALSDLNVKKAPSRGQCGKGSRDSHLIVISRGGMETFSGYPSDSAHGSQLL